MKEAWTITVDGVPFERVYSSLKGLCGEHELSYSSASKGRRVFFKGLKVYRIRQAEIVKR